MLPAAAFSGELDEPRIFISFFSCVEKSGPAHHRFTLTQFFGMFFKTTHFFTYKQTIWFAYMLHDKFTSKKFGCRYKSLIELSTPVIQIT